MARLLAVAAALLPAAALASPYASTYTGTIAHSDMTADAPDGATFTLTLVFDNGGATAAGQNWGTDDITCGFWRWRVDGTRSVAVALDLGAVGAAGTGKAITNALGVPTGMFTDVNTGGTLAWADYGISGLPAGSFIGWAADGAGPVFGMAAGGSLHSFDDGSGTAAGGVQMLASRWSAPLPFTGACDASAVPPVPPTPPAPTAIPALSSWGVLLLSGLLGLGALGCRRKFE